MSLFTLSGAVRRDPRIEAWLAEPDELRRLARAWFDRIRACGDDVRELLHDGWAVACVEDAPFAYVTTHKAHVSVGLFYGAAFADPAGLLQGAGKRMRHAKVRWGEPVNAEALGDLIAAAYADIRVRLGERG